MFVLFICFSGDNYVLYYHSGKKTLRLFRQSDTEMIANYRMQAELTAIKSKIDKNFYSIADLLHVFFFWFSLGTIDGKGLVLGTADGCLSVFSIADPEKEDSFKFLAELPSRDEQWKKKLAKRKARIRFKATITLVRICLKFEQKIESNGSLEPQKNDNENENNIWIYYISLLLW